MRRSSRRAAASLIRVGYAREACRYDLAEQKATALVLATQEFGGPAETRVGDFEAAFAAAPMTVDVTYTVPAARGVIVIERPHAKFARAVAMLWLAA